jgi:hypothetical protein
MLQVVAESCHFCNDSRCELDCTSWRVGFIHFCLVLMQKSILFLIPTDQNVTTMRWDSPQVILFWICL